MDTKVMITLWPKVVGGSLILNCKFEAVLLDPEQYHVPKDQILIKYPKSRLVAYLDEVDIESISPINKELRHAAQF